MSTFRTWSSRTRPLAPSCCWQRAKAECSYARRLKRAPSSPARKAFLPPGRSPGSCPCESMATAPRCNQCGAPCPPWSATSSPRAIHQNSTDLQLCCRAIGFAPWQAGLMVAVAVEGGGTRFLASPHACDPNSPSSWRCMHTLQDPGGEPVIKLSWQLAPDREAPFVALATEAVVSVWCYDRCAPRPSAIQCRVR